MSKPTASEQAIAEAKRRQAADPDASWIATRRDGEWTVVRIGVVSTKPPGLDNGDEASAGRASRRSTFPDRTRRLVRRRRWLNSGASPFGDREPSLST